MPKRQIDFCVKGLASRNESGFVLVATIAFLALMTILVYFFSNAVDRALMLAIKHEQAFNSELDRISAEQTALYLYSTRIKVPAGIYTLSSDDFMGSINPDEIDYSRLRPQILMSGNAYRFDSDTIIKLQDETGLVSISNPESQLFEQISKNSLVRSADLRLMQARFMDFIDRDDVRRLNGAESFQYKSSDIAPPPNTSFKSPREVWKVLGFEDVVKPELWIALQSQLTPIHFSGINPNAINRRLLDHLGWEEALKQEFDLSRIESPFIQRGEVEIFFPPSKSIDGEQFRFFPSNYVRITTQSKDSGITYSSGYKFDFRNQYAPWELNYRVINLEEPHLGIISEAETTLF